MAKRSAVAAPTPHEQPSKWSRDSITVLIPAEFTYNPSTKMHHGRVSSPHGEVSAQSRTLFGCKQALSAAYENARKLTPTTKETQR